MKLQLRGKCLSLVCLTVLLSSSLGSSFTQLSPRSRTLVLRLSGGSQSLDPSDLPATSFQASEVSSKNDVEVNTVPEHRADEQIAPETLQENSEPGIDETLGISTMADLEPTNSVGAEVSSNPTDANISPTVVSAPPESVSLPPEPVQVTELASAVAVEVAPAPTFGLGPNAPTPGFLRKTFPKFPWHRLPNSLTYLRCAAIPALVASFYQPGRNVETAILFAAASLTDWLDGYLARRWDITSAFGAFLDPVADKLMVSTCLILLSGRYGPRLAIPSAIILARELAVSALREWMAQRGERDVVKVGLQGKVKTALTMLSLCFLLLVPADKSAFAVLEGPALWLLYASTAITVTSGSVYYRAASPLLFQK